MTIKTNKNRTAGSIEGPPDNIVESADVPAKSRLHLLTHATICITLPHKHSLLNIISNDPKPTTPASDRAN
jgi:hypothetical protein